MEAQPALLAALRRLAPGSVSIQENEAQAYAEVPGLSRAAVPYFHAIRAIEQFHGIEKPTSQESVRETADVASRMKGALFDPFHLYFLAQLHQRSGLPMDDLVNALRRTFQQIKPSTKEQRVLHETLHQHVSEMEHGLFRKGTALRIGRVLA